MTDCGRTYAVERDSDHFDTMIDEDDDLPLPCALSEYFSCPSLTRHVTKFPGHNLFLEVKTHLIDNVRPKPLLLCMPKIGGMFFVLQAREFREIKLIRSVLNSTQILKVIHS